MLACRSVEYSSIGNFGGAVGKKETKEFLRIEIACVMVSRA